MIAGFGVERHAWDGDGYDDIVFLNTSASQLLSMLNTKSNRTLSTNQFNSPQTIVTGASPLYLIVRDFDLDGKLDVAVSYQSIASISIFTNTSTVGNITFTKQDFTSLTNATRIDAADLDGDGKAEIVTIHGNGSSAPFNFSILKNTSTSTISFASKIDYSMSTQPLGLAIADINLDSKPDILITRSGQFLSVFQNQLPTVALTINTQPNSIYSVCDGAAPVITTSASGTTNITYQWQFSTTSSGSYSDLTNSGGYSNVATSGLTINSTGNFGAGFYRCKINGDFVSTIYSNTVSFTVNALPTVTVSTSVSNCGPNSFTLTASGATNGNYYWYDINGLIAGQSNNTYTTPSISLTSTYWAAITDGTCVSSKTAITATINNVPVAPITTNATLCSAGTITLTAAGGTNGQYRWYTVSSGGTAIAGEVNSTYITPSLSTTTAYYTSINNGTCESIRTAAIATINALPTAPTTTGASICGSGTVSLTAAGGTNGQYHWYTVATGGTAITGEVNGAYVTPSLSTTTPYYTSINNGTCESTRTAAIATINALPTAPTTTGASICGSGIVSLTATGGTNGQYRWYNVSTGGTAIAGELNGTYVTPSLSITTSYYVSTNNGICESTRTQVTAAINAVPTKPAIISTPSSVNGTVTICSGSSATLNASIAAGYTWSSAQAIQQITITQAGTFTVVVKNAAGCASPTSDVITVVINTCNNEPPTLAGASVVAEVGGKTSLSIPSLIGKISSADLATLKITKQPSSGAKALIDANFNLILDYAGLNFIGQEQLTIQVCNFNGSCVDQIISIDVGTVIAYNGISANGDSKNAILFLKYIDVLEDTKRNHVSIYNRWGDTVFEVDDYDNVKHVFTGQNNSGADLPTGTYFYKIEYFTGRKIQTGYLSLKR